MIYTPPNSYLIYMRNIRNHKRVTKEQEKELGKRIKKGDRAAINELVEANLSFVAFMAPKFQNSGLSSEELIQEGNLGLIRAAELFDYRKGFKFVTFAGYHVEQKMRRSIENDLHIIRIPVHKQELMNYISKPGVNKKSRKYWQAIKTLKGGKTSLNDCTVKVTRLDAIKNNLPSKSRVTEDFEMREFIQKHLAILTEKERDIITCFFGLGGERPLKLHELGTKFKVHYSTIRYKIEGIISKLRTSMLQKDPLVTKHLT